MSDFATPFNLFSTFCDSLDLSTNPTCTYSPSPNKLRVLYIKRSGPGAFRDIFNANMATIITKATSRVDSDADVRSIFTSTFTSFPISFWKTDFSSNRSTVSINTTIARVTAAYSLTGGYLDERVCWARLVCFLRCRSPAQLRGRREKRLSLNIEFGRLIFLFFPGVFWVKTRSPDGMDCRYRLVCVLCSARRRGAWNGVPEGRKWDSGPWTTGIGLQSLVSRWTNRQLQALKADRAVVPASR
ncbi:hypothetical protein BKA61DRAFT_153791 [Leptodontidium sp. MPI-SDFR-AT-0119]|nr:hypothetical protein BKA61DRAFT_153791 [Leptodontidium sp. MPI-SDFR-AT-0119]